MSLKKIRDIFSTPEEDPKLGKLYEELNEKLSFKLNFTTQNIKDTIKTINLTKDAKEVLDGVIGRSIAYSEYNEGILGLFTLKEGKVFPNHRHPEAEALWVIDGEMEETITKRLLKKWDVIYIKSNVIHSVAAKSDCTFFLVWENLS